ncbi:hypothetical protein Tco_1360289 [Tanacetum coccineum]
MIVRNPWSSLIPLSRGSFDVIVGMDWLSKRKFVIVCHEKVVRIPLEGDEILQVHGERTQGVVKTLMNTKSKEEHEVHLKISVGVTEEGEAVCQNSGDDQLRLRWMIYLVVLADAAEKTLEDIIRACVIDFGGSYHLSIRCALFEALYGRKYRSPVLWAEIGESSLTRLGVVQETTDKVVLVKEKLKAVIDRQKSDVDYRRKPLEFEVGPFEILERIGLVAYRLRLPKELKSVHDTFHVSNLKKCMANANLHVPLDEIKVDKTLRFI